MKSWYKVPQIDLNTDPSTQIIPTLAPESLQILPTFGWAMSVVL